MVVLYKDFIDELFSEMNTNIKPKNSKVDYLLLLQTLLQKMYYGNSYDICRLKCHYLFGEDYDESTIIRARNNFTEKILNNLISDLIDKYYSLKFPNKSGYQENNRILAVDGTYIALDKNNQTYYFTNSPGGHYICALISCIYDITNDIPLAYKLHEKKDEREALVQQFNHFKENDILIMDRGYYCSWLIFKLKSIGVHVICRLKTNLLAIQKMENENLFSYKEDIKYLTYQLPFKYIRYQVKDPNNVNEEAIIDYYLGTTIMDDLSLPFSYDKLYHKRWTIETHFKLVKYGLSLNKITSRTLLHIKQDIIFHLIISIILETFYFFIMKDLEEIGYEIYLMDCNRFIDNNGNLCKINKTTLLYCVIDLFIPFLMRKPKSEFLEESIKIFKMIEREPVIVMEKRHFDRTRKKPQGGWSENKNNKNKRLINKKE